ncbi:hypothetical protein E3J62_05170 [candidate division TA06 bacterium]|uniref:Response regulatory domain-containing protein n=1 Tax=candidate division TA06 bacterium TaxID=2250710 RepID=A0A523UUB5_UNCT6|nr:MAG: hypothetical protein E3J62_05170 [candidate division TA06 bacterium]
MNSTILAVVSDYNSRTRLYHLASELDLSIDFCETIGNAIGRLKFYNYSAIIVDFDSVSIKPDEVVEGLRKVALGIPILAIVNRTQARSADQFEISQIIALITKPIDAKTFSEAMQKLAVVSTV